MRVTEANVDELLVAMSDVKENIEMVEEAAEEWKSAREDGTDADATREAREALDEALDQLDASTLCQLVHGKHKGK
ncbi:MAG TPA: hypothetical protein VH593_29105 [Ktedonobacteraceae bacterium]|jgi:hypothetical protein